MLLIFVISIPIDVVVAQSIDKRIIFQNKHDHTSSARCWGAEKIRVILSRLLMKVFECLSDK